MAAPPGSAKSPANKLGGLANPSTSKNNRSPKALDGSAHTNRNSSSRVAVRGKSKPLQSKRRDEAMDVDDDQNTSQFAAAAAWVIKEEKPKLRKVLEELRARTKNLEDKVATLAAQAAGEVAEDPGPRNEGGSFLAAKQTMLLSYCQEVCSYAKAKATGQAMFAAGVAGRMMQLRTAMEKLRPMDRKLKYQTDKLLGLASADPSSVAFSEGGEDEYDPLSFRPRPEVMTPSGEEAGGTDEQTRPGARDKNSAGSAQTKEGAESGFYKAPRLSSVPHDEDGIAEAGAAGSARSEKRPEKRRNKLLRGEVMEILREEFGEQPETVKTPGMAAGVSDVKMKRLLDEDKERLNFEEDHMVRLTVTRKAKKVRAQMEKDAGRLETIADVGSAADFVRVAKDADGFGMGIDEGNENVVVRGRRGRNGGGKGNRALGRAMGAVGGSMSRGKGRENEQQGKKTQR